MKKKLWLIIDQPVVHYTDVLSAGSPLSVICHDAISVTLSYNSRVYRKSSLGDSNGWLQHLNWTLGLPAMDPHEYYTEYI